MNSDLLGNALLNHLAQVLLVLVVLVLIFRESTIDPWLAKWKEKRRWAKLLKEVLRGR